MTIVGHHDVGRFDVAMDDPAFVGKVEGVGHLAYHAIDLIHTQEAAGQPAVERGPFEVLHDNEVEVLVLAHIVNGDNVGVFELCGHDGFAMKAAHEVGVHGQLRRQDLDGHDALQRGIIAAVDNTHTTATDFRLNFVLTEASANQ